MNHKRFRGSRFSIIILILTISFTQELILWLFSVSLICMLITRDREIHLDLCVIIVPVQSLREWHSKRQGERTSDNFANFCRCTLHDKWDQSAETQPSKSDLRRFQFVRANLVLLPDYPLCRLPLPLSLSTLIILSLPFNLCKSYSLVAAAVTKLRRENSWSS